MDEIVRSILTVPTTDLGALVTRVGELLVAAGVSVWRLNIAQLAMHPEVLVQRGFWTPEGGCVVRAAPHDALATQGYTSSPVAVIYGGAPRVRRRLQGPDAVLDYPICHELAAQGATDYVALPLVFTDGRCSVMTVTTRAPGGFSEANLSMLERRSC